MSQIICSLHEDFEGHCCLGGETCPFIAPPVPPARKPDNTLYLVALVIIVAQTAATVGVATFMNWMGWLA